MEQPTPDETTETAQTSTTTTSEVDVGKLREEALAATFDAVAARQGLEDTYQDVAGVLLRQWLNTSGKAPTKDAITEFMTGLKASKPALFRAPIAANTAPTLPAAQAGPAAPAPGAVDSPTAVWRALKQAGRTGESEAYYRAHRRQILRGL